jgi:hypothetical protein
MGLKQVLEKMRLVEVEPRAAAPAAASGPGRPAAPPLARAAVPLDELLRSIPEPKVDVRALPEPELTGEIPDFAAVYRAAGVDEPAHGFSAFKVLEILSSPDLAALDPRAKAGALAGFLKMNPAGPVPVHDILQDAVRRDQALDKFEEFLREKLLAAEREVEQKNAALQAELDALSKRNRERMEENRQALVAQQRGFATWQARKRIEERRLYDAVGPFVEENPISLGGPAPPASKNSSP